MEQDRGSTWNRIQSNLKTSAVNVLAVPPSLKSSRWFQTKPEPADGLKTNDVGSANGDFRVSADRTEICFKNICIQQRLVMSLFYHCIICIKNINGALDNMKSSHHQNFCSSSVMMVVHPDFRTSDEGFVMSASMRCYV